MNPLDFALKRPVTVVVGLAAILVGSGLALSRTKIDIFPNLDLPVIYVVQPYGGMDPRQIEGLITFPFENHFLYISGIHHIESRTIQGFSQMRLFFHTGTDMVQAMAETVAQVNRARAFMPPGTVPPFVLRFDAGSVPVGYLVLASKTKNITEIQDHAYIRVRPLLVSLPGVSAPPPFGGNQRTIVIHIDPERLKAHRLSPDEVVAALNAGNTISPSGNVRIQDQILMVPSNAQVADPQELQTIPIRPGSNVFLKDILDPEKGIEDGQDIPTSFALVNGRRAVFMLVTKRADASTLAVVNAVKESLPNMRASLPEDIDLRFEFDQSPNVTRAMWGVVSEGALGAVLTGLMVLLFLRDWRSALIVAINIPFALLGAVVALWLTGQTINIMTLGGLALAVGILVDESTVEIENIHTQMHRAHSVAHAVWLGNQETAVPRLLAMLCILSVFTPSFFMEGAARALFVPLSLAVGFSMVISYFLSSTLVPVLAVWLLRHGHAADVAEAGPSRFSFARIRAAYARGLERLLVWRRSLLAGYFLVTGAVIVLAGLQLGSEIFPRVDSGQFQLRVRGPTGTRIERTEQLATDTLDIVNQVAGRDNVDITVGFGGVSPSSYTINTVYIWTGGPEECVLRVALKHDSGIRVEDLETQLRDILPARLRQRFGQRLRQEGVAEPAIAARLAEIRLSFEPADVINEVMSFGAPTPIEIVMYGPNLAKTRDYAEQVMKQMKDIPTLKDLQTVQTFNYPTAQITVDRQLAGGIGVTAEDVSRAAVPYTSSSRFTVPNYWVDSSTGTGYQVQVEVPQTRMDSLKELEMMTIKPAAQGQVLLRDVGTVYEGVMPGEIDRYNMRRTITITANVVGEDMGRAARRLRTALRNAGNPPRGVTVAVRGQVAPMEQMFTGLAVGLALSVVVIFLLLAGYFQSLRLAICIASTVPAVLAGVTVMLLITGTTVNIQSFMGAIMAIGVAVANGILLLTFAEGARSAGGKTAMAAAVDGAGTRLRPILMTSFAMLSGMVPMALALGEGGEQTAPLGRAVIGGLLAATVATLTILPAVFSLVMARASSASASLHWKDPASVYHVPVLLLAALALLPIAGGCSSRSSSASETESDPPLSRTATVHPVKDTWRVAVEQPGQIEPFEITPIYANIAGFVSEVCVDMNAQVKKGDCLARLKVPEMEADLRQRIALIDQANAELALARKAEAAAEASLVMVKAQVAEARSHFKRTLATHEYWSLEHKRIGKLVDKGVLDDQTVDEIRHHVKAADAERDEAAARIDTALARVNECQALCDKARAEAQAAETRCQVAQVNKQHAAAMLEYATLVAPFDGIVSERNVHTGHLLKPASDASSNKPLFTVVRTDRVRIFVDVPETEAAHVHAGTPARVRIHALKDHEIETTVARISWLLNPRNRTLRAEIELANTEGTLRPGMYAYATLLVDHAVWALPVSCIESREDGTFCYVLKNGEPSAVPIRLGSRRGGMVELLKIRLPERQAGEGPWTAVTGDEAILQNATAVAPAGG